MAPALPPMVRNLFDRTLSVLALLVLLPLFAMIAVVIRVAMGSPVFFRQVRIGHNERPFTLYKFRTMKDPRYADRNASDSERLTGIGRWLRAGSADELPQFWNVLKGDMSLVGPRPLLPEYLPLYDAKHRRRHEVKPGITGWAQIRAHSSVDWDERLDLDVWYVDHRTLWLDLRILVSTLAMVLGGERFRRSDGAPMPPFKGSRSTG